MRFEDGDVENETRMFGVSKSLRPIKYFSLHKRGLCKKKIK